MCSTRFTFITHGKCIVRASHIIFLSFHEQSRSMSLGLKCRGGDDDDDGDGDDDDDGGGGALTSERKMISFAIIVGSSYVRSVDSLAAIDSLHPSQHRLPSLNTYYLSSVRSRRTHLSNVVPRFDGVVVIDIDRRRRHRLLYTHTHIHSHLVDYFFFSEMCRQLCKLKLSGQMAITKHSTFASFVNVA